MWLIKDDRFVAGGNSNKVKQLENIGKVYLYYKDQNMTEAEAAAVSDHYPVEIDVDFNIFL